MLLSILIQGKNDKYGSDTSGNGGVDQRLRLTLNQLVSNVKKLNKNDIEIVLCDWGSDKKIVDHLLEDKPSFFKCVYVDHETGKKYSKKANYSISHAYNVAFRHSSGEYVIYWDSDCWIRYEDLERLYNFVKELNNQKIYNQYYWGSRYHVPREIWNDADSYKNLIPYFDNINLLSIKHDKIFLNGFDGRAMALLIHKDMAISSTGWWEELPYWGVQDIEFNDRLSRIYTLAGDLEDIGIVFFHLNHHDHYDVQFMNANMRCSNFAANDENWGLRNEKLNII
jgi:predicted glycosyltransferase involved in capsule biosynthesis